MIKLEWECPDCGQIWIIEDESNKPLEVSQVIELDCDKCCGGEFELVINRR